MNIITWLDYQLFVAINQFAGQWLWLDVLARLFLNDYFVPTVLAATLLTLWFEGIPNDVRLINQKAVLVGSLSALAANIILKIINLLYFRLRPFHTYEVNLLFYQPTDSSLPSNAAAFAFAVGSGVWLYQRRWGWFLLASAALFGLSRIFGGVHYPLDVLVGAGLGCFSAWLIRSPKRLIDTLLQWIITLTYKVGLP